MSLLYIVDKVDHGILVNQCICFYTVDKVDHGILAN